MKRKESWSLRIIWSITILFLFVFIGCNRTNQSVKIDTDYKAIFLDNGPAFFGKLDEVRLLYGMFKDVLYVQSQVVQQKQDKKAVKNIVIQESVNRFPSPAGKIIFGIGLVLLAGYGKRKFLKK